MSRFDPTAVPVRGTALDYQSHVRANATQLNGYRIVGDWYRAGVPAADAVAWANQGFMPAEARPLIAVGITPQAYASRSQLADLAAGGPARFTAPVRDGWVLHFGGGDGTGTLIRDDESTGPLPWHLVTDAMRNLGVEVHTVSMTRDGRKDPRYPPFIDTLNSIADQLWADAEHTVAEHPAKRWSVVYVDGEPAAWCAAQMIDGVMRCTDGYERPGPGRDEGLYPLAYHHRQATQVQRRQRPAVTHLFEDPPGLIEMYEADGWVRGATGPGELAPHVWWELTWNPDAVPDRWL